jgi:G3E family GTPase
VPKIPIIALCGFLGSGKTTLLRRWFKEPELSDAAMLVHDLSELGIDAELLSKEDNKPEAGKVEGRVAALHGIHSREQLFSSMGCSLKELQQLTPPPPVVLSESTGAARPWPLIEALTQNDHYFLRHFIITVDALNFHRDYDDGQSLLSDRLSSKDQALHHAAIILAEQIAFASIIILTKTDTVSKQVVQKQVSVLQKLHPNITIALSAQAGLRLDQLDAIPEPSLAKLQKRAEQFGLTDSTATSHELDAIIFRERRPFHPERLHYACKNYLSTGLYRTKGFLWLASRPGHVFLWQQSGSQISLELTGQWRSELIKNSDKRLLPEEVEHLKQSLKEADPTFGDRHNELTLIGLPAAREAFFKALQDALCTDEEVLAWQNGAYFPDPWPNTLISKD